MSTKQKERLISLLLSLWFELAIRLSEKDGLTLFLSNGISPPLDEGKVTNIFLIRRSYLAIYSTNLRKKGDLRRKKVRSCVKIRNLTPSLPLPAASCEATRVGRTSGRSRSSGLVQKGAVAAVGAPPGKLRPS